MRSLLPFPVLAVLLLAGFAAALPHACGQTPHPSDYTSAIPQAPVVLRGKTLFSVQGVLSFPAQDRAAAIGRRIGDLSRDVMFNPDSLKIVDAGRTADITAGDLIVMSVTDEDAQAAGTTRDALARKDAAAIAAAVLSARHDYSLKSLTLGALYAVIATILLLLALRLLNWCGRRLDDKLDEWRGTRIRSLRIQKFELVSANRIADFALSLLRLLHLALVLAGLSTYLSVVLDFFPWTRGYGQVLLGYFVAPLRLIGRQAATYLPNLVFIAVIAVIALYVIRFVRILFREIGKGTIVLPNFYPDWAGPTYKIVRFMILTLTVVVIFPYLPGAKSPAFQGVSIFLGVLISLGSTSAVANVVAGVILTYMRAFKVGDRVKIADTVGDVMEKTLLVTRIKTIKNVEITIANAMVLSSHIFNFSASATQEGLILHTAVTIGYDAPWRTVHQLLVEAALSCKFVLREPSPFVYQTALDDFYVHYEINAYTLYPAEMAQIYSELHQQIQDKFNDAGVEIMSSHYANVRDGNRTTIPEAFVDKDYVAPQFLVGIRERVEVVKPEAEAGVSGF
jgi:small-conductance mechanosensitive channel